jgi:hypothetical protein
MKKSDLIKQVARQHGVKPGTAADQMDTAVNQIVKALRNRDYQSGEALAVPAGFEMNAEELAVLICRGLERSPMVEVDGLGVFRRDVAGNISFDEGNRARVFIAYAVEDVEAAEKLYADLEARGFSPWLDRRKLLPGQNWPRRIEEAIEGADFFIACFSRNSVGKRGGFQAEVRHALECAHRVPLDDVYLIPVRLDHCRVPTRITRETQYLDLFPDWDAGLDRIAWIVEKQRRRN